LGFSSLIFATSPTAVSIGVPRTGNPLLVQDIHPSFSLNFVMDARHPHLSEGVTITFFFIFPVSSHWS